LYFCDFGLYLEFNIILDCTEVYLDFNKNYNLALFRLKTKKCIFFN